MKPRLLSVSLLAGVMAMSACGGGSDETTSTSGTFDPATCQGGTLSVLNQGGLTNFDPARIYTSGGGWIPSLFFRTLTTRHRVPGEAGEKPIPDLATDLGRPSDNAKTWTYTLKDGLKFDDGTPITSKDIKYAVERSFSPDLPGGAPYLQDWLVGAKDYKGPYKGEHLKSVETPDEKTIVFKLSRPHGDFPYLATDLKFSPVPQAKDTGVAYEKKPVSSGPYRFETYETGKKLTLVRNEHWSRTVDDQRLACPDRIEVTAGLDPAVISQRLAASVGADAKAITTDSGLAPAQLAQIASDKELAKRVVSGFFPETKYIAFDTTKKPFDDLRVRQAIAYAVNRESAVNAAGGSTLALPATTFLPPSKALGQQPYDHYPAGPSGNAAKAKELLAAAGQANLTFELVHENDDSNELGPKQAAAFQDALKQAGVTVKLKPLDSDEYRTVTGKPATQPAVSLQSWGADWPAGGPFLIPIFDGRSILKDGGNFNLAQLDDPKVNDEIDAISAITDPAEAAKRWGALDVEIAKKALIVPLIHPKTVRLHGKDIKNVYLDQWRGSYDISAVSVK